MHVWRFGVFACSDNPSIMDYIRLKHDLLELEKQAVDWRRKIEILQMERNRTRQLLKSVTGMTTAAAGQATKTSSTLGTPHDSIHQRLPSSLGNAR